MLNEGLRILNFSLSGNSMNITIIAASAIKPNPIGVERKEKNPVIGDGGSQL